MVRELILDDQYFPKVIPSGRLTDQDVETMCKFKQFSNLETEITEESPVLFSIIKHTHSINYSLASKAFEKMKSMNDIAYFYML